MDRIASFHLIRERPGRAVAAMARLGADRPRMARIPGLVFWRLLGTGRADDTGPGADLRRTALFAVWEREADLDTFCADSPIATRWSKAAEAYHLRLRGLGGHGTWRGVDITAGLTPGAADGPIAVLTRADVRRRAWRPFRREGVPVAAEVRAAPGLLAVVGIGEAPIGRLGTFSLWRGTQDIAAFLTAPHHREVVARTRAEDWYAEELFARFEPYGSRGSWAGRDPLGTTGHNIP